MGAFLVVTIMGGLDGGGRCGTGIYEAREPEIRCSTMFSPAPF